MPVNEGMAKAYMMLHGTSFFESARISNNLLHRNKRAKQIYLVHQDTVPLYNNATLTQLMRTSIIGKSIYKLVIDRFTLRGPVHGESTKSSHTKIYTIECSFILTANDLNSKIFNSPPSGERIYGGWNVAAAAADHRRKQNKSWNNEVEWPVRAAGRLGRLVRTLECWRICAKGTNIVIINTTSSSNNNKNKNCNDDDSLYCPRDWACLSSNCYCCDPWRRLPSSFIQASRCFSPRAIEPPPPLTPLPRRRRRLRIIDRITISAKKYAQKIFYDEFNAERELVQLIATLSVFSLTSFQVQISQLTCQHNPISRVNTPFTRVDSCSAHLCGYGN
ncbi:unnamed protein product [Trichogramma brassicae]|uniref:Uncharacterized protein n=1 Tax=Trichogramma brassicae TaxID=86971 RepID=A0A6H5I8E7_9HYME|nr:unnamed protein product [Trichogramma brassicae]